MRECYLKAIYDNSLSKSETFELILKEYLDNYSSIEEINNHSDSNIRTIYYKLKELVTIEKSPYDIESLAYAIQISQSGIGGAALTKSKCHKCNEVEYWGNTNTPLVCNNCSLKMAREIIVRGINLNKVE